MSIRPVFVTNSADAAIEHARRGAGVAMLLSYQVVDDLRAGRLSVVLARFEPPPLPIQIVYPATRLPAASLRAFVDLAVKTRRWTFTEA